MVGNGTSERWRRPRLNKCAARATKLPCRAKPCADKPLTGCKCCGLLSCCRNFQRSSELLRPSSAIHLQLILTTDRSSSAIRLTAKRTTKTLASASIRAAAPPKHTGCSAQTPRTIRYEHHTEADLNTAPLASDRTSFAPFMLGRMARENRAALIAGQC